MVELELDATGARLVCRFEGRMDAVANPEAQALVDARLDELLPARAETLVVVFDVEKVSYVSSAFLRICLSVAKRVGTGRFSVRGTNPTLKKIFLVAGFDNAFPVD